MNEKAIKKLFDTLKDKGYEHMMLCACPKSEEDIPEIMAIKGKKIDIIIMICAIINAIADKDDDEAKEIIDAIKRAFERKKKLENSVKNGTIGDKIDRILEILEED